MGADAGGLAAQLAFQTDEEGEQPGGQRSDEDVEQDAVAAESVNQFEQFFVHDASFRNVWAMG